LVLGIALGGCAVDVAGDDTLGADEVADEARVVSWERFVGAWERDQGGLTAIVFTSTEEGRAHQYFADREVQCVRAPCPPVREEGTFRATTRYLYLTQSGVTARFSYTLSDDTLTLRSGTRVVHRFHRVASYCGTSASDCDAQSLIHPLCVGAFTCTAEHRCAYRCGTTDPSGCTSNADCAADQYCQRSTCSGSGTCAARPDACITLYNPVCGCDGRTYSNACAAASAGANVASTGACR
jgi:hypothetical protein